MKTTIFLLTAFCVMVFVFVIAPFIGLALPAAMLAPKLWLFVAALVIVGYFIFNERD